MGLIYRVITAIAAGATLFVGIVAGTVEITGGSAWTTLCIPFAVAIPATVMVMIIGNMEDDD